MRHNYQTKKVCSNAIDFDLTDGVVSGVSFQGGCEGNLKGISQLVEGRSAAELVPLLAGIKCGKRGTSCPAQLAIALKQALKEAVEKSKKNSKISKASPRPQSPKPAKTSGPQKDASPERAPSGVAPAKAKPKDSKPKAGQPTPKLPS
jgi:uncharacterized protein (TIGR03905 family)